MLNKVILMGRLVRNPESRITPNGVSVSSFTIAVDADLKGANGEKQTDFFDVTAWRKLADFANVYLSQGRLVVVAGRLKNNTWEDNDGKKHKKVVVIAENIYFADSKKENAAGGYPPSAPTSAGSTSGFHRQPPAQMRIDDKEFQDLDIPEDDLPF